MPRTSLSTEWGRSGGQIIYATEVTELVQEADGRVTGLLAQGRDGSSWTVGAKAVCLTTGGFAANPDMIAEYYPEYADYEFNCAPGSTGEGILMGQKAGGRHRAHGARARRLPLDDEPGRL